MQLFQQVLIRLLLVLVFAPYGLCEDSTMLQRPFVVDSLASDRVAGTVLAAKNWAVGSSDSVRTELASSRADIDEFAIKYLDAKPGELSVCSAAFVDLSHEGGYQLVLSIDYSGRKFCNQVLILQRKGSRFESQTLTAWEIDDVNKLVQDLDRDGRKELLIPEPLTPYSGAQCMATWTHIYVINGSSLADVSSDHRQFYEARLRKLRGEIKRDGRDSICGQIEVDKAERFLGILPDAGFARAQEWMQDENASLRLKAIAVLADIGNRESLNLLSKSTQDKDPVVADAARESLTRLTPR